MKRLLMQGLGLTLTLWISVTVILSVIAAPFSPLSAPEAEEWSEPAQGAGRDVSRMKEEKMHDTEDVCKLQSSKILPMIQDETASGEETRQVTVKLKGTSSTADAVPLPHTAGKAQGELDGMIRAAAERYGIPWELVSAVVWAESRYDPYAVSSTPDYGLMQITQSVMGAYGLAWDERFDPERNLDVGCRILREKLDLSGGDFTTALTRYRFGDAEAMAMWAAGIWSNWYSERVLGKYYEILRGEGR